MRRLALPLAVIASLIIAAAPAAAATTYHTQERGSGLNAYYSNVVFGEDKWIAPGDYFETWVDAATYMTTGDGAWEYQEVCVYHGEFTIDESGDWFPGTSFWGCGEIDTLTLDRGLNKGQLAAAFAVDVCVVADPYTGECDFDGLVSRDVVIDLTLTGIGRVERWHGTSSGGSAGMYQYTAHGNGSSRAAAPTGTITLDGASLIDGATLSDAWMFQSKSGYVDIWHE